MEPIKHTQTARFRSLEMYRPELDRLVAFFQNSCASVVLSDNQHVYISLDEMKTNVGIRIKALDIRGEKPGVHFLLNQEEYPPGSTTPAIFNELRTEEITDQADNLFFRLKDFLESLQRPTIARFLLPAIVFILAAYVLTLVLINQGPPFYVISGIVICIAFSVVFVWFGAANSQNYLILETKLNAPSFFVRNREFFAKHAVAVSISGIVGLFFGWLLGHFLK